MQICLTHRLFAHGALVGVARRLVVMRVGNQSSANPKNRERLDLQMRVLPESQNNQLKSPLSLPPLSVVFCQHKSAVL